MGQAGHTFSGPTVYSGKTRPPTFIYITENIYSSRETRYICTYSGPVPLQD